MPLILERNKKIILFSYFAVLLLTGFKIYKDYGVGLDEYMNHRCGQRWTHYIYTAIRTHSLPNEPACKNPADCAQLKKSIDFDRLHGPDLEIALYSATRLLHACDSRQMLFLRHLGTFFVFFIGMLFFYRLCVFHFKDWKLALLGCVFLTLSPRIFNHSFYNSVDIGFFSFSIIGTYTLLLLLDKPTYLKVFFHALTCAFVANIRPFGLFLIPTYTLLFLTAAILNAREKEKKKHIIKIIFCYVILLLLLFFALCPYLWADPLHNFKTVVKAMLSFSIKSHIDLYLGKYLHASHRPWHYPLVWISISTPLLYLFLFIIGFLASLASIFDKKILPGQSKKHTWLFLLSFLLPLTIGKGTFYDGWRHLFFIYPFFLLFSLTGLRSSQDTVTARYTCKPRKIIHFIIAVIILLNLSAVAYKMIRYHPYQDLYFNSIAGKNLNEAKSSFELDYWGISYRKALEYILTHDNNKIIPIIAAQYPPGFYNTRILLPQDRQRIHFVFSPDQAKYFLTTGEKLFKDPPDKKEYASIQVDGVKIITIYTLKGYSAHSKQ